MAPRCALRLFLCLAALLAIVCGPAGAHARPVHRICPRAPYPRASADPATRKVLVPAGAIALTICSYRGLSYPSSKSGTLLRSRRIGSRKAIARLARKLDRLPPDPVHCISVDGPTLWLLFAYRHRPVDRVLVDLAGCQTLTNGQLIRWAGLHPELIDDLRALAR